MKTSPVVKYLLNGIWLTLPPLLWNILFASQLPHAFSAAVFWKDIPPAIAYPENFLRVAVFIFPLFMPLAVVSRRQRVGVAVYLAGLLIYFAAWIMLMVFPQSAWSTSWAGFLAPAYTPLLWLVGIGLIGDALYFPLPYTWWYYVIGAAAFLAFHISHTALVYSRLH